MLVLLALVMGLSGCGAAPPQGGTINVVATLMPLGDWASQVGGNRVQVEVIVPPGANPRTYEPTSRQQDAIQTADVVLLNGLGLEPWIEDVLGEARNRTIAVFDASQFVGPLAERVRQLGAPPTELGPDQESRRQPGDERLVPAPVYSPYLWLDTSAAMTQVDLIAQTLARVDPDGYVYYRQNAQHYRGELENLDSTIFRQLNTWRTRTLLASNRFLYPFVRHYDITLNLFDPVARPTDGPLEPLLFDALTVSRLQSRGAVRREFVPINALIGPTYIEMMRTNVGTMTRVMGRS